MERTDKKISQACHAKRFLRNERKLLGAKPRSREFVGQIIAFIDESHLDVCGRLKACPVIITLANFNSDVISGDGAKKVLLYVPLVDFTQAENKDKMRAQIREKIMDSCWEIILKQIIELQKEPLLIRMFGEREPYVMKPVLYFIAQYQDTREPLRIFDLDLDWVSRVRILESSTLRSPLLCCPFPVNHAGIMCRL